MVLLWDLAPSQGTQQPAKKGKGKNTAPTPQLVKTILALERVEAVGFVKQASKYHQNLSDLQLYMGGQKGFVTVRGVEDKSTSFILGGQYDRTLSEDEEEQKQIVNIL